MAVTSRVVGAAEKARGGMRGKKKREGCPSFSEKQEKVKGKRANSVAKTSLFTFPFSSFLFSLFLCMYQPPADGVADQSGDVVKVQLLHQVISVRLRGLEADV